MSPAVKAPVKAPAKPAGSSRSSTGAAGRDKARASGAAARRRARATGSWDELDRTDPPTESPVTKAMSSRLKREAAGRDAEVKKASDAGKAEGQKAERDKAKAAKANKVKSSARRQAKRTGRQFSTAARRPAAAARSGSMVGILAGSLALILLYDFLIRSDQVAGFLAGPVKAVQWLSDPHAVIPFK